MINASNTTVCCLPVAADHASESYKSCMLNEPCHQWVLRGHMHTQAAIKCQLHRSNLTLQVTHCHLGRSGRLRVVRH